MRGRKDINKQVAPSYQVLCLRALLHSVALTNASELQRMYGIAVKTSTEN